MKIFILLAIAAFSMQVHAQSQMVFKELEHDFGTFREEAGVQSYTFTFENKGKAPLILNNVMASCGCTTPEWTQNLLRREKRDL